MVSIGSLVYDVVADTADFQKGVFESRKELNAAKRVFLESRTPAERLGIEIEALRRLMQKGAITTDTYRRKVDRLKNEFNESQKSARLAKLSLIPLSSTFLSLAGAATAAGAAIRAVGQELTAVDEIAKTSRKLGVATDELIALRLAGSQLAGLGDTAVSTALQRMTRRIAEAAAGSGEAKKAIEELGLSAEALNRAGPALAFRQIADAIQGVENDSDKLRLAFKLFDSEGAALVNVLREGGGAIDQFRDKARELGLTFSDETAASIEETNDAVDDMKLAFQGLGREIAGVSAGPLQGLADSMRLSIKVVRENVQWWKELGRAIFTFGESAGVVARSDELDRALEKLRSDPEVSAFLNPNRTEPVKPPPRESNPVLAMYDAATRELQADSALPDTIKNAFSGALAEGENPVLAMYNDAIAQASADQALPQTLKDVFSGALGEDPEKQKKPVKVELPPAATRGSREEFQALARLNNQQQSMQERRHAEVQRVAIDQLTALTTMATDIAAALEGFFPEPVES